jgi:hypothetical protein
MKVIIAGSRTGILANDVFDAWIASGFNITEVVSGCARGVDSDGEYIADQKGIPVRRFPADWDGLGKRAGYIRNAQMAEYADALIAVWDGKSRGTAHMIETMRKLGKQVYVHRVEV